MPFPSTSLLPRTPTSLINVLQACNPLTIDLVEESIQCTQLVYGDWSTTHVFNNWTRALFVSNVVEFRTNPTQNQSEDLRILEVPFLSFALQSCEMIA